MRVPWKRLIASLLLGGGIVLGHWMILVAADDFTLVRPYESGFTEVNPGSMVAEANGLAVPMPDGSRETVPVGGLLGYKVFTYGFPFSYRVSEPQLPMCTPAWQVPIRIALNLFFFAAIWFGVFSAIMLLIRRRKQ